MASTEFTDNNLWAVVAFETQGDLVAHVDVRNLFGITDQSKEAAVDARAVYSNKLDAVRHAGILLDRGVAVRVMPIMAVEREAT